MHLKPTAGYQISFFIFEKKLWKGGLYKYHMKNISRTAKFLPRWDNAPLANVDIYKYP